MMRLHTDDFFSPTEPLGGLGKPIRKKEEPPKPVYTPVNKEKGVFQDKDGRFQTIIPGNEEASRGPVNPPKASKSPRPGASKLSGGWKYHGFSPEVPEGLLGIGDYSLFEVEFVFLRGTFHATHLGKSVKMLNWDMVHSYRILPS